MFNAVRGFSFQMDYVVPLKGFNNRLKLTVLCCLLLLLLFLCCVFELFIYFCFVFVYCLFCCCCVFLILFLICFLTTQNGADADWRPRHLHFCVVQLCLSRQTQAKRYKRAHYSSLKGTNPLIGLQKHLHGWYRSFKGSIWPKREYIGI